ncbi:hypothetical protein FVE85_4978 [Porphyridium purpureum]|uniref:Armadillo repeat-containing protein 1 n=1 Tax=Porphyridium purpureum TaxID=35688 RepID=A0A5J4YQP9_PORPP|nr:hypothetical protein FVE85_4978 [Porphyridium purpureum]|eukprot:POR0211..scf236_6
MRRAPACLGVGVVAACYVPPGGRRLARCHPHRCSRQRGRACARRRTASRTRMPQMAERGEDADAVQGPLSQTQHAGTTMEKEQAKKHAQFLAIASQLLELSSDFDMQPVVAREDGCVSALVKFAGGATDAETCRTALRALDNLASHPDNFALLRGEQGLWSALKVVMLTREDADRAMRTAAFGIMETLTDEINYDEVQELRRIQKRLAQRQQEENDTEDGALANLVYPAPESVPQAAVPGTLRVHCVGLSEEATRRRAEVALTKFPGVHSVTIEVGPEVLEVQSTCEASALLAFLPQVNGQRLVELIQSQADSEETNKENANGESGGADMQGKSAHGEANTGGKPAYLDDLNSAQIPHKSVTHAGGNSLAARLEEQKRAEMRKKNRANRFFSNAFSFW